MNQTCNWEMELNVFQNVSDNSGLRRVSQIQAGCSTQAADDARGVKIICNALLGCQ